MSGVSTMANAYFQSSALRAKGDYQKQQFDTNAKLANLQADDADRRGNLAADQQDLKTKQVVGAQRAAYGSSGVDVNSGSAGAAQATTNMMGQLDALTIRNNAMRQAFGYRAQAADYTSRGQFAQDSANNESTLMMDMAPAQAVTGTLKSIAPFIGSFGGGRMAEAGDISDANSDGGMTGAQIQAGTTA